MPYFLHVIGANPLPSDRTYATKAEALADRLDGYTVTFIASANEQQSWHERERARFNSGHYIAVPWADDYRTQRDSVTCYHFAHVSIDVPGMIAYTPDDEKGILDRQTRVRPGKYLQQFCGEHLTPERIADYASRVKAYTEELKIATTPDDIVRAYIADNGPTSCMDGRHFGFDDNPVRAYGDSDLACAYVGTLGERERDSQIAARAIVWPARKLYSRIYGDVSTLQHVLRSAGYEEGSMRDAKIRAVSVGDDNYLMPYVDGIGGADLRGEWFVLGRGDYCTDETGGTTQPRNACNNCGERCDRDESYCSYCENNRRWCERCEEDHFDSSDGIYSDTRGEWRCNSCWETRECECCDTDLHEYDYSRSDWECAYRCSDCELKTECSECGDWSDDVDQDEVCRTCRKCSECGEVCERAADRDSEDRCESCADAAATSRLTPPRPIGRTLRLHRAGVNDTIIAGIPLDDGTTRDVTAESIGGWFLIHRTLIDPATYTLTHALTGKAVLTGLTSDNRARALAAELVGLDWAFTDPDAMPPETRNHAVVIVRRYR